jgi:uncharacterized protein with PIN domain
MNAEYVGDRVPDLMAALEASLARAKQNLERCPTCNGLVRVLGRYAWGLRLVRHLDGQGSFCSQSQVENGGTDA